jgi:membrane protease YdiL (CAAX protease family)
LTTERTGRPRTPASDELALAGAILASGIAMQRISPRVWETPIGLAAALGAVGIARARGTTWEELGLRPTEAARGLRLGAAALLPLCGAIAVGGALSRTRHLFVDERVSAWTRRELTYHTLVRVPLATATTEELLFRSALLGTALSRRSPRSAVAWTSLVFGLWHALPALESHDASDARAELADRVGGRVATVGATVAITALAGAAFGWLRLRSRSVVAPIVVHAGANMVAIFVARRAARRRALR